MNDMLSNIKKVLVVFLMCFLVLIMYITYFEFFTGPKIVSNPNNRRLWVKRNEVLRGTIYDRENKPLTKSYRVDKEIQKREYINGELFAHVLGYVNIKYGITGIERKYDEQLMSTSIQDTFLDFIKSKGKTKEKIGNNLITTLDFDVQKKAYDLLGDNKGAVVALNPKNGEVIALVSKPSYNPNNLEEIWGDINKDKNIPLINRATSGLYPPGSIFKTITGISALENMNGVVNRTFNDQGSISFNSKYSLSNFANEVLGNISFKQAYVHSSNVVFGTLALELGNDTLKDTAEKFYFNKNIPTNDFTIENSKFPKLKMYEKGNIAQTGIGQSSILTTPMEMALVTSTVANNGVMMKPFLVKEITTCKGENVKTINSESIGQVMSSRNAKIMKDLMRAVVEEGTGRRAAIEGVSVCGKTGTADHKNKGNYSPPHSWFIGFAPYENPQVAVAVIVEEGGQGGIAAAGIASKVMREALK